MDNYVSFGRFSSEYTPLSPDDLTTVEPVNTESSTAINNISINNIDDDDEAMYEPVSYTSMDIMSRFINN